MASVRPGSVLGREGQKCQLPRSSGCRSRDDPRLGFGGENSAFKYSSSVPPAPASKRPATINRPDNEALFIKSMSRRMSVLRVFVGRDERRGDKSRVMTAGPGSRRSRPSHGLALLPSRRSQPRKLRAHLGSNWWRRYLNGLRCWCLGFYTFSRGFSLLQRASSRGH